MYTKIPEQLEPLLVLVLVSPSSWARLTDVSSLFLNFQSLNDCHIVINWLDPLPPLKNVIYCYGYDIIFAQPLSPNKPKQIYH